ALKHDDSSVGTARRGCHPAFPHAVSPVFVRGRVNEDYRFRFPQRFLKFGIELPGYFRADRGGIRRLEHPEGSPALLINETTDCGRNRMVRVFVTNKNERGHRSIPQNLPTARAGGSCRILAPVCASARPVTASALQ